MDKTKFLGMKKSLHIRVKIDVRKSLKKHVSIKIRGGELCKCPVRYEKLPLICFYCGMLGDGTNDCKDVVGDTSPVKNYGQWLRASPCKPVMQEEGRDGFDSKRSCGKRLFFTKPRGTTERRGDSNSDSINIVTSLLDKVDIGCSKDVGLERRGSGKGMASAHSEEERLLAAICPEAIDPEGSKGYSCETNDQAADERGGNPTEVGMTWDRVENKKICSRRGSRVKKWKKFAREGCVREIVPLEKCAVGSKRMSTVDGFDVLMEEFDARGDSNRRAVPMELDQMGNELSESLAGLTTWALGCL